MTDKERKPPGVCEGCFSNPENHIMDLSGARMVYCAHNSAAAYKVKIGWQIFWPVAPEQMTELLEQTAKAFMDRLEENRARVN